MMVCRDRDTGPVQPAVCSAAPSAGSIGISFRVMTRIVTSPCLVYTMLTSWSMLLVPLLYHRGGLHGSHTPHPQQGRPRGALAGGTLLPHGPRRLRPQARQSPKIVVCAVPPGRPPGGCAPIVCVGVQGSARCGSRGSATKPGGRMSGVYEGLTVIELAD